MSGFSSLTNTAIGGVVAHKQAMDAEEQKKKDEAKYNMLMQAKQQELTMNDQSIDMNDQKIAQLQKAIQQADTQNLKNRVDVTKTNFANKFMGAIDTLSDYQGNMAKVNLNTKEKSYTIPEDVHNAVADVSHYIVNTPQGSDWVNHFMDGKYGTLNNPITNLTYDPRTDEMVLKQRSGKEIRMNPTMMYNAMGLGEYTNAYQARKLDQYQKKSVALYNQHKALLEDTKVQTDKQDAITKRYDAETKRLKLVAEMKKSGDPKESIHDKLANWHTLAAKALENPNITKEDVRPLVTKLKESKDFTDTLKKDGIYDKVNKLKYFASKSDSFSKELSSLEDGVKTGSFETVNKMFIKYTGKGLNKDSYLQATDLATRMNLLVMDYLQYKSGAAFGQEELKGYQAAGGISDFTSDDMAKQSLKGMATYLKNKLSMDIQAVPNANQRLVLEYDADMIPTTTKVTKIATQFKGLGTKEEKIKFLTDLKNSDPKAFAALKKELVK